MPLNTELVAAALLLFCMALGLGPLYYRLLRSIQVLWPLPSLPRRVLGGRRAARPAGGGGRAQAQGGGGDGRRTLGKRSVLGRGRFFPAPKKMAVFCFQPKKWRLPSLVLRGRGTVGDHGNIGFSNPKKWRFPENCEKKQPECHLF